MTFQGSEVTFSDRKKYDHYVNRISLNPTKDPFICSIKECEKPHKSCVELFGHFDKKHHHIKKTYNMMFICPISSCFFRSRIPDKIDKHFQNHSDIKIYKCWWNGCSEFFSDRNEFNNHLTDHTNRFPCYWENCYKKFPGASEIESHEIEHIKKVKDHYVNHHPNNALRKPFVCSFKFCKNRYSRCRFLKHHIQESHPIFIDSGIEIKYICPLNSCGKWFFNPEKLDEHYLEESKVMSIKCKLKNCGKIFSNTKHYLDHFNDHKGIYSCYRKDCGRRFNNEYDLETHEIKDHIVEDSCVNDKPILLNETPFICSISKCKKKYNSCSSLDDHFKITHKFVGHDLTNIKYICPLDSCNEFFLNPFQLDKHFLEHSKPQSYKCDLVNCTMTFSNKDQYRSHEYDHDGVYPCFWDNCKSKFADSTNLESHEIIHIKELDKYYRNQKLSGSGREIFLCSVKYCKKIYRSCYSLNIHFEDQHKSISQMFIKKYICPLNTCNEDFKDPSNLDLHFLLHSEIKFCSMKNCNEVFKDMKQLNDHISGHYNLYACFWNNCDKKFVNRSKLEDHEIEHIKGPLKYDFYMNRSSVTSVEEPFVCSVKYCGKKYISCTSLTEHFKVRHNKIFTNVYVKYICPLESCNKCFLDPKTLDWHYTLEHGTNSNNNCKRKFDDFSKTEDRMTKHTKDKSLKLSDNLKKKK